MRELFLKTLVTFLCCLAVGMARDQLAIFNPHDHRFEFVLYGIIFAVFYFLLTLYGFTPSALWLCLAFIVNSFLRAGFGPSVLVFDIIYFIALSYAVYLFAVIINKEYYKNRIIYYPLLGVFLTISGIIHYIITYLFNPGFNAPPMITLMINLVPEFLTGLGLGLGVYITSRPGFEKFIGLKENSDVVANEIIEDEN